jgi:hypothetical protein
MKMEEEKMRNKASKNKVLRCITVLLRFPHLHQLSDNAAIWDSAQSEGKLGCHEDRKWTF